MTNRIEALKDLRFWTDHPVMELGDTPAKIARVRECVPISYDGNKYCLVRVEGVTITIKSGYIYQQEGRLGNVPAISKRILSALIEEEDDG